MKKLLFGLLLAALPFLPFDLASGQNVNINCATGTGANVWQPASSTNPCPVSASVSVNGFATNGNFANLTATGSSADVALPAGTVIVLYNTGTTAVSCQVTVGAGVATANMNIIQASSWMALTVGSNTHASCIDQTGSTSNVVVLAGGSGIATGSGGGGGSSSSGGGGGGFTFTPNLSFATLTATGSSASVALPSGTAVMFTNTGTTTVSCTLGIGSATAVASNIIIPASTPAILIVGSNTFGACIDQTGSVSNVVVLAGGALSTASTPVTQSTSPWVVNETQIGSAPYALGFNVSAASAPITIASDSPGLLATPIAVSAQSCPANPVSKKVPPLC